MAALKLLSPLKTDAFEFKNRVFMAPMSRSRSPDRVANELTARYYAQRATAGLIITEGTQISEQAIGWTNSPGIYTDEHIEGWRKVTQAVHEARRTEACRYAPGDDFGGDPEHDPRL